MNWLKHPDVLQIPAFKGFELLKPEVQGIWFDGAWKNVLKKLYQADFMVPADQAAPYDGEYLPTGEKADVKLFRSLKQHGYVYISHNEKLYAETHDTEYPIYAFNGVAIELVMVLRFSELGEALERFYGGKQTLCAATGKSEVPWSIDISRFLSKVEP